MNNRCPNILVVENNSSHIAHAREHIVKTYKEFNFSCDCDTVGIYPANEDYESFIGEISKLSTEVNSDREEIDVLFLYIAEQIEKYNIDTILLDFLLCDDEEEKDEWIPQDTTGGKLAKKLKKSRYKDIPIVSFTKINEGKLDKAAQTYKHILFNLPKDFTKDFFGTKEAMFYKWIYQAEEFNNKKNLYCDIAIICALQTELDAILNLDLEWKKVMINDKLYRKGSIGKHTVVATSENKMGMPEASTVTTRLIELFNPKYVVMTGIAAGIDHIEQNFLDLLMPDRLFNWQAGKYKVKKESGQYEEKILHIFEPDYRSEDTFLSHYNAIEANKMTNKILKLTSFEKISIAKPEKIEIYNEGMVSGSSVVADVDIVNDKIKGRKIYGIDMEAYGVTFACNNAPSKPKSIIIKSICDFADADKDDDYQEIAMNISAKAFYVLFTEFITE